MCNNCRDQYKNLIEKCSAYPQYNQTEEEWLESNEYKAGGLYHPDCTYYLKLED